MNIPEAARRLNVAESHITSIRELDSGGHVVTLRSGQLMLVSQTTARVFVPEVDEPATGGLVDPAKHYIVGEDGPPPFVVPPAEPAAPKPKTQRKGKTGGSGS